MTKKPERKAPESRVLTVRDCWEQYAALPKSAEETEIWERYLARMREIFKVES